MDDPHLLATGGLASIHIPDPQGDRVTGVTPLLPFTLDGERLGVRTSPPAMGEHTQEILSALGYSEERITALIQQGVVATDHAES